MDRSAVVWLACVLAACWVAWRMRACRCRPAGLAVLAIAFLLAFASAPGSGALARLGAPASPALTLLCALLACGLQIGRHPLYGGCAIALAFLANAPAPWLAATGVAPEYAAAAFATMLVLPALREQLA